MGNCVLDPASSICNEARAFSDFVEVIRDGKKMKEEAPFY
jgi:hypothetical protein